MRRPELALLGVFLAAAVLVAVVAQQFGRPSEWDDPRPSTYLSGPTGLQGLAETLELLGVPVERRRYSLFGLQSEGEEGVTTRDVLLLAGTERASRGEWEEVAGFVNAGGLVVVAGGAGPDMLLGLEFDSIDTNDQEIRYGALPDGVAVLPLPPVVFAHVSDAPGSGGSIAALLPSPTRTDTVLALQDGRAVAIRAYAENGGEVLLLSAPALLANEGLKDTDAGVVALDWILARSPDRLVVDEYHLGFGQSGAVFGATWSWLRRTPIGWVILQLAFAGLVALAVGAVRFGPGLHVLSRRRRSPLEHVDALGTALERAGAEHDAVALIVDGLRRRLAKGGQRRTGGDLSQWLDAMARATDKPEAREAARRLARLLRERGAQDRVLAAATTVEDVWEALRRGKRPATP